MKYDAAKLLILKGGKILFVRSPTKWSLPGGKVDPGETIQQTMERELNEELPELDLITEGPQLYFEYEHEGWINYVKVVRALHTDINHAWEIVAHTWIEPKDVGLVSKYWEPFINELLTRKLLDDNYEGKNTRKS